MPNDSVFPPDLVTAHASSLRALARSLALDEHAADDVVQETWLRALSSPPAHDAGIGGWLRRVAEGFALRRHRSEARRAHREKLYARERPEAVASADSRAETLRAVVEAVLSLEEPYRETVLLRWFEGLPPRDIAARQGASVATVNSRLQRAHGLLRERLSRRLDIDERKLQGLLLAIFGTSSASTAAAAVSISLLGVTLSTTKLVLAGGVAAVALCAWIWCNGGDRIALPPVAGSGPAAQLESPKAVATDPEVGAQRIELAAGGQAPAAEPAASVERAPYEFDLTVVPTDPSGRPASGVDVSIGLEMQRLARLGQSAWNGELHTTWNGWERSLDMVLEVDGALTPLRRIHLTAGTPAKFVVAIASRQHSETFELVLDMEMSGVRGRPARGPQAPAFARDAVGNGVFTDPWLLVGGTNASPVEERTISALDMIRLEAGKRGFRVSGVRAAGADMIHDAAHLAGTVHDEAGAPQPGVLVTALTESDGGRWETTTDVYGRFDYAVPHGRAIVYAGGGDRVLARKDLELAADETGAFDMACPALEMTHVRLLDADKKPLAKWRVEGRQGGADGRTTGSTVTDEDGRATLFLLPPPIGRLYVGAGAAGAPKMLVEEPVSGRGKEAEVVVGAIGAPGLIVVSIDTPPTVLGEARMWRVDSGEGLPMPTLVLMAVPGSTDQRTLFRCDQLVPGAYEIEYGAPGVAWTKIGPFYLERGQELDAGTHRITEAARLAVEGTSGAPKTVTVQTRVQGLVLRSAPVEVTSTCELDLEIGAWTLTTGMKDAGTVRASARTIQAEPGRRVEAAAPAEAPPR